MRSTTRISAVLVLCGCTFLSATRADAQPAPPPPQMAEGPAIAQVRAGDALLSQGRYQEAAQQYESAYAIDPALPILERLADAYRLAGDSQRAMVLYQRIAAARGQQPAPPPPPPPAPPTQYVNPSTPVYYAPNMTAAPRRAGSGLINAGVGLLVAGYGMGIVGGAITMGATYATNAHSHWYGAGGMLMIPIVGPFATIAYERSVYWAAPWAVISGGMQIGGLAMIIAGAAVRASHKAPAAVAESPKKFTWNLSPYQNPQGGGMLVSGTF